MGWQFAAVWGDDPDGRWKWVWRRIADDSGATLEQSGEFNRLDDCIEDARRHGFDEDCGAIF
jgi:hypothetical protein